MILFRTLLFVIAAFLWQSPTAMADTAAETTVKAAVVHKIAKFVAWPEASFELASSPLRFCVVGDVQFFSAIEKLAQQTIHGRPMEARLVKEPDEASLACDILYLGDDPSRESAEWTAPIQHKPVLTFAETDGYAGNLSIVRVLVRRDKVRFEINLDANSQTGLRISGQLLQLAAAVSGRGN